MLWERGSPVVRFGRPREEAAVVLAASSIWAWSRFWSGRFVRFRYVSRPHRREAKRDLLLRRRGTNRPARFRSDWQTGMHWLHSASGWAVEEKSKPARETWPKKRTGEYHRTHQGRARPESYRPQIGVQRAAGFIVVKATPQYSKRGAQPGNRVQSMAASVESRFEACMTADW